MAFPLDALIKKAKKLGHSPEYIKETVAYAKYLESNGVPVIFDLLHLCLLTKVNYKSVNSICNTSRRKDYKKFKLAKKKGGFRIITSPKRYLKYLQKWILANILYSVESHPSCKGFDKGTCIKANAEIHLNSDAILKIDLLRFFDSINERRVYGIFKRIGYNGNVSVYLAKICTVRPKKVFYKTFRKNEENLKKYLKAKKEGILPQGAPTSPKLSNLVCKSLDKRLTGLASKNNLKYSRYADDLTFSGNAKNLRSMKKVIYRIIREENFFVNYGKTKLLKRGARYFVTGLSVHNEKVTVPRNKKKEIEHHLFHCLKNGVKSHKEKCNLTKRNFKDWLLGSICFVYSIEPEVGQKYFDDFRKIDWPI